MEMRNTPADYKQLLDGPDPALAATPHPPTRVTAYPSRSRCRGSRCVRRRRQGQPRQAATTEAAWRGISGGTISETGAREIHGRRGVRNDLRPPLAALLSRHHPSAERRRPFAISNREKKIEPSFFFWGFLIICHRCGDCLSDCQLYHAKYKFALEKSNSAIILPLLLTCTSFSLTTM